MKLAKSSRPTVATQPQTVSPEVDGLISAYLDGTISQGKSRVLHGMLERSKTARRAYVGAIEEHFGIAQMFRSKS